ncbi:MULTISPECIES: NAD(P)H-dependent oxidoreductase [unclassified Actinopolyspora]|uniref:NADPH-dependent FMN reductase n=1 Tax=Actinopolyspora TaxID=1849 RepID=UPI0013F683D0|nr:MULTISPECIES: NAD(P)H-dependent oxidoreductase [unclassified Actinopolyspora]NHD17838.1 NAD(P)H-dependent oxidoreductase [Actinopolyspora sp. BKK2]NHE77711.1 NAD(P)H-dependent oxidoreductase [Actinopolyspora sp. BKK1]
MSSNALRLAVIIGSVRQGRFGPTVGRWVASEAERFEQFEVDLIDLAEFRLSLDMTGEPIPGCRGSAEELRRRLGAADAFVVVTPEYNRSFPAALKNVIDHHKVEWYAKPVGLVSYGGIAGGLHAVENLRQVFAEVRATTVRDTVSFHGGQSAFDEDGAPVDQAGSSTAAKTMFEDLAWWARALVEAKEKRPYLG